jgi:hypothetical protein
MNFLAYGHEEVIVPHEDSGFSKHWKPGEISHTPKAFRYQGRRYTNKNPIAIWPTRTTSRIMAQNGCFTVHGSSKAPLEKIFENGVGPSASFLLKIEIKNAPRVDEELADLGVGRLRLFPELHNVASRLRRVYKTT